MKQTITFLAALLLAPLAAAAAEPTRPNILFLFSDDHALRTIGA
jgi:hypothetical protein